MSAVTGFHLETLWYSNNAILACRAPILVYWLFVYSILHYFGVTQYNCTWLFSSITISWWTMQLKNTTLATIKILSGTKITILLKKYLKLFGRLHVFKINAWFHNFAKASKNEKSHLLRGNQMRDLVRQNVHFEHSITDESIRSIF